MRQVPAWLEELGEAFAVLPAARQREWLGFVALDLEARTARLRDRIRPEDLAAYDAAVRGMTERVRAAGLLAEGAEPRDKGTIVDIGLDNRGLSVLASIPLRAVREGAQAVGIDVSRLGR